METMRSEEEKKWKINGKRIENRKWGREKFEKE